MFLFSRDLYKRDGNSDSEGYVTEDMHSFQFPLTRKLVLRSSACNAHKNNMQF
jgi:hypothetical protein